MENHMKKSSAKTWSGRREECRGWVAKISLVLFFLAYVSLGAYVFMLIETSSSSSTTQGHQHHHTPPTEEIRTALSGTPAEPSPKSPAGSGSEEMTQMQELMTRQVLDRLWDITENLNILYKENWTRLASEEISRFHDSMQIWMKKDCNRRKAQQEITAVTAPAITVHHHVAAKWNYPTAFLYALSVITTLGSCPVIPESSEGKMLTILYAGFGIPLLLFYLTVVGSALSSCMVCCPFDSSARRQRYLESRRRDHSSSKSPAVVTTRLDGSCSQQPASNDLLFHHPMKAVMKDDESLESTSTSSSVIRLRLSTFWPPICCLILILVYIASGTWVFSSLMSLPFMDALLLSFMLFTTMGIPDAHSAIWNRSGPLMAVSIYIFIGLTLCSLCFNLIYEWLLSRWTTTIPCEPPEIDRRSSR